MLGFRLPSDTFLASIAANPGRPPPADFSSPSLRSWLARLPTGSGRSAAFETRTGGYLANRDRETRGRAQMPAARWRRDPEQTVRLRRAS